MQSESPTSVEKVSESENQRFLAEAQENDRKIKRRLSNLRGAENLKRFGTIGFSGYLDFLKAEQKIDSIDLCRTPRDDGQGFRRLIEEDEN